MIAKSEELRRSLNEINNLLQALRSLGARDDQEREEIEVLEQSRRSIVNLLESRRKQNRLPVVSLQAWRDGSLVAPPFAAERYAAVAQANQPASGAPRPYRVS
ncbi:MAG: hypothetical protein KGJ66_03650 [Alphaproteobacteria bacterium]|nr:hypothetical protein [Alphaproteobacteria bacterium]